MTLRFITKNESLIREVIAFKKKWSSNSKQIPTKTSGSTGDPKLILIQKEHMRASARATLQFLGLKSGDTALLCLSPKTIGGKMMIVRAIEGDLDLIVTDITSDPLIQLPSSLEIDFAAMVPLQLEKSLAHRNRLNTIQQLIIGGAAMSSQLIHECKTIRPKVFQTFGMTETISHIALRNVRETTNNRYEAVSGVHFEQNEHNELIIHAPFIGVERLMTHDVVRLHSPTSFSWLGRSDFVINSGGIKIHPEIIEQKLSKTCPFSYFSFGIKDQQFGTKHVFCIESSEVLSLSKTFFQEYLDKYEIPKEILYFHAFIYTESGKINRKLTLEQSEHARRKVE